MNSSLPHRFAWLALFAATTTFAFAAAAKEPKDKDKDKDAKPAVAVKAPELHFDSTPVTDGKAPVVSSYADVIEPVQKTVVSIYSTKTVKERVAVNPFFRQFGIPDQERESKQEGLGSGVIVSADGYILTNNHVVEGADELKVSLSDDREFIAKVIGTDPKTDIAVVKIEAEKLPTITLADSAKTRVGDLVFAVGNPLGVGQTVTMGIISAKSRSIAGLADDGVAYQDFIQTDAAINLGNSGGALVDAKGRLVGINSAILSPTRGNIGIGFAIPTNLAASIMNSLIATGKVARGFLGIRTDPLTPDIAEQLGLPKDTRGVVVTDIDSASPAEKAGLKRTDVILAIGDHAVTTLDDLRLTIAQMVPGSVAKLKISRDGKDKLVEVTLGTMVDNPNELLAGVNVTPLTGDLRRKLGITDARVSGLVITDVAEDSPFRDRLAADLVIIQINRAEITDLASAKEVLNPPGQRNLFMVYYRGSARFVSITTPSK